MHLKKTEPKKSIKYKYKIVKKLINNQKIDVKVYDSNFNPELYYGIKRGVYIVEPFSVDYGKLNKNDEI